MKDATYALYRGDELIDIGTCKELAERRFVKPSTIYYYGTPAYRRRFKEGSVRVYSVRIEK